MTVIDASAGNLTILDLLKAAQELAGGAIDRSAFLGTCCDRIRERMAVRAVAIACGDVVWSSGLEPAQAARYRPLFEGCQPRREPSLLAQPIASGCLYLVERVDGAAFEAETEETLRLLAAELAVVLALLDRAERAKAEVENLKTELRDQMDERRGTEEALQGANSKLAEWVLEVEQRNRDTAVMKEISDLIQASVNTEEANVVMARHAPRLFPANSGAICLLDGSGKLLETVACWGETEGWERVFLPEGCWSLRLARPHYVGTGESGLQCTHLGPKDSRWHLCVPLMAHGQPIGLLHLSGDACGMADDGTVDAQRAQVRYIRLLTETLAEQLGMSLANLRLREALRAQAIRDPLTGLFNRRYMEESLTLEIRKAEHMRSPLSCIMVDIDFFKKYNDAWGHAAGDSLLRALATFLRDQVRSSDIVCRYGGEEFTLILPNASLEIAKQRAEGIRAKVSLLRIEGHGDERASVSLSLGVACYPEHGMSAEFVMRAADLALYQAKREGRNRVVSAVMNPQRDRASGTARQPDGSG